MSNDVVAEMPELRERIARAIHEGLGENWAYINYGGDEWNSCRYMLDDAADEVLAIVTPPAVVAALVEALEAFSVAIPAVLDAADIDAADTVFTVRAVSPTGSRELAQRSLADMLEAARAALALYREAGR
jgi:hypothetical protein